MNAFKLRRWKMQYKGRKKCSTKLDSTLDGPNQVQKGPKKKKRKKKEQCTSIHHTEFIS